MNEKHTIFGIPLMPVTFPEEGPKTGMTFEKIMRAREILMAAPEQKHITFYIAGPQLSFYEEQKRLYRNDKLKRAIHKMRVKRNRK